MFMCTFNIKHKNWSPKNNTLLGLIILINGTLKCTSIYHLTYTLGHLNFRQDLVTVGYCKDCRKRMGHCVLHSRLQKTGSHANRYRGCASKYELTRQTHQLILKNIFFKHTQYYNFTILLQYLQNEVKKNLCKNSRATERVIFHKMYFCT